MLASFSGRQKGERWFSLLSHSLEIRLLVVVAQWNTGGLLKPWAQGLVLSDCWLFSRHQTFSLFKTLTFSLSSLPHTIPHLSPAESVSWAWAASLAVLRSACAADCCSVAFCCGETPPPPSLLAARAPTAPAAHPIWGGLQLLSSEGSSNKRELFQAYTSTEKLGNDVYTPCSYSISLFYTCILIPSDMS